MLRLHSVYSQNLNRILINSREKEILVNLKSVNQKKKKGFNAFSDIA